MTDTLSQPPSVDPLKPKPKRQMPYPLNIYQTAVGKKWVMGLTGLALVGFVVVHMIGNLHLYEGPKEIHEYAETLRALGTKLIPRTWLLWFMRIGLIVAFALHIHSAYTLSRMSIKANSSYKGGRDYIAASFASRTMRWTGPIIGIYLIYHLADLTWGWLNPDFVSGDPYHNVSESLSNLPVALLYIAGSIALAIHVYHGAWSMFQSLGINNPRFNAARRGLAGLVAVALLIGNLSFPIMVQADVIDDDGNSVVEEMESEEEEAAE
jgi:succinate dehydrogenase / fumarate reductase cytochrome b subunit